MAITPWSKAHGVPRISSLATVLSQPNIVIAVYLGEMRLRVVRALRGNLRGTIYAREEYGEVQIRPSTLVVAFLGPNREFRFVARVPLEMSVETAPLSLLGFCDTNAHIVTNGLLSLRALEERLAGQRGDLHFRGSVFALDDRGEIVQTRMVVDATVDAMGRIAAYNMPRLLGSVTPRVRLAGWNPSVAFSWTDAQSHELRVEGIVDLVDRSGTFITRFQASYPEHLLREVDLRNFVTQRGAVYVAWPLVVRFSDAARTTWSGSIGDDQRIAPVFRDAGGHVRPWTRLSAGSNRFIEFADERWELDPRRGPLLDSSDDYRILLQHLLQGPLGFRISSGPREDLRGSIRLGQPEQRALRP
ncbi:MAG: hypothetical protein JNK05_38250 [Myxococcales bacterium]|nr:hypothetical protein [Myxococcales bacterium]